jgi:hypothetical protein
LLVADVADDDGSTFSSIEGKKNYHSHYSSQDAQENYSSQDQGLKENNILKTKLDIELTRPLDHSSTALNR